MKLKSIALIGAVLASLLVGNGAAYAAVNDFEITNYDMRLELGRDSAQRSTLRTTETITALFPEIDQNHGIERAIPATYDGHATSLKIESVKNEKGEELPYTTYESNGNEVVRIGESEKYVRGSQTYVLTYTQRDVTRYFTNTQRDEFYWDLNGTEWQVPIRQFGATISYAPDIAAQYKGMACYKGAAGATGGCGMTEKTGEASVVASSLAPGENVTVALGYAPKTFAAYEPTLWERVSTVWFGSLFVTGAASVGVIGWLSVRWARLKNRSGELGTIVPEYLPPKDASIATSAEVLDVAQAVFAAQLLDLAVRKYLKIYETKAKSFWSGAQYTLEITQDIATLKAEEQELLRDIFDGKTTVGERLEMKTLQNNTSLYKRLQDNPKKLQALVRGDYSLREQIATQRAWYNRVAVALLVLGILTVSPFLIVAMIVAYALGATLWVLTDKGLALRRYLEGLKLYISVAEVDRLKFLQSPEAAEKVGAVDGSPGELVKLYEKTLPYAVLFGQEKEWSKQLGEYYAQAGSTPGWYSGADSTAFNAAMLSSAIGNFTTASSYASASSSSSGGSSGGGSSGGGGGGGGGGGW